MRALIIGAGKTGRTIASRLASDVVLSCHRIGDGR
jgi:Trk K+ transport system NAD-binding subunit